MKQKKDIIKKYKTWGKLNNYYSISKVPPGVASKLMTGFPNIDPNDTQNNSPMMKDMVKIAKKYKGTLGGYVIPVESGRDDARISFDEFTVKASMRVVMQLRSDVRPDECDEVKKGYWRFWWD